MAPLPRVDGGATAQGGRIYNNHVLVVLTDGNLNSMKCLKGVGL